jgi:hypothetical protein
MDWIRRVVDRNPAEYKQMLSVGQIRRFEHQTLSPIFRLPCDHQPRMPSPSSNLRHKDFPKHRVIPAQCGFRCHHRMLGGLVLDGIDLECRWRPPAPRHPALQVSQ